ncbi:MAG: phosphoadenosine phosphosulfate reductase family protein [Maritimibacter sp.]
MPFEASAEAAPYIAANEINTRFPAKDAIGVVGHALSTRGNIALVSSFGTESVVLLHMVANVDKAAPVLFLETGMLFVETLAYQQELADKLGLNNVQVIRPDPAQLLLRDTDGLLHQAYHYACCDLRKV